MIKRGNLIFNLALISILLITPSIKMYVQQFPNFLYWAYAYKFLYLQTAPDMFCDTQLSTKDGCVFVAQQYRDGDYFIVRYLGYHNKASLDPKTAIKYETGVDPDVYNIGDGVFVVYYALDYFAIEPFSILY